jgi:SPOR domain
MRLTSKHILADTARLDSTEGRTSSAPESQFILSLCSVAAPTAIQQPRGSQLARFQFFFSHSLEHGRKQYRLQMGYFQTRAEAEKWLAILGKVYPDAFVGEVPAPQSGLLTNTQILRVLGGERADDI